VNDAIITQDYALNLLPRSGYWNGSMPSGEILTQKKRMR
jgi:hypothetical protein